MSPHEKTNPISRLAEMRETYMRGGLDEAGAHPDPLIQFETWFAQAVGAGLKEPNAMTLATVTPDGRPAARIVLLKEVDRGDFIFYTNYESRKGRELEVTPYAALIFYWGELERQVRVEGEVRLTSRDQSEAYFHSRPKGHQLGAWASAQSRRAEDRNELEARLTELEEKYEDAAELPLPDYWGGYRVTPRLIEFWQGRPNRMHDRIEYVREAAQWKRWRLWP
jgi:pyridoxamine 5'-phosphate oxidase